MTKIAIIGAGLSGLTVAHLLKDDAEVIIFEKSRGVGGRISTRRAEPYFFDHGAQYFTARTKPFQDFIQPLLNQGIVERWNARYALFDGNQMIERTGWQEDMPRYVGVPSMNHMAKYVAEGMDIQFGTKIKALQRQDDWQLTDDQEQIYSGFDWVICSIPSPQALELLSEDLSFYSDINAIKMSACYSLMLGFEADLPIDFDAARVKNSDISWMAANRQKPGRTGSFTLLVHSTEAYANAHIDGDREQVLQHLVSAASRIIGHDVSVAEHKTLHGWRYAQNTQREIDGTSFIDQEHLIGVCGDWSFGGRVEGAFMSAFDLVQKLKAHIS
jgi:renalase